MRYAIRWALVCLAQLTATAGFAQDTFTPAQAQRGAALYQERCASCHGEDVGGDRNGVTPALFGPGFLGNWGGLPLSVLLDRIRDEASQTKGPALSRQQQVDLLSFLLATNGIVPGERDLPTDVNALSHMLLQSLTRSAR